MKTSFWRDKKVLVTGHTGFKGSWLSLWLQKMGAEVIGYALPAPTRPSFFEDGDIAKGMASSMGDIRDRDQLNRTITLHRPEIIIHMAAQAIVRQSYRNPIETYEINVMGTANLLDSVRQNENTRVVIVVTSDKCYENKEWVWGYRESDAMGGYDPYSSSKGCAEIVTAAFRNSFFQGNDRHGNNVCIASVRAGNVIGGGDWADFRLIPDIYRSILNRRPLQIRNPDSIRPWQFVLEPLSGYLSLAEEMWDGDQSFSEGWNFGPPATDCKSVSWIVEEVGRLWEGSFEWHVDQGPHPHEAHFLQLDCSKATRVLGWTPKLNLKKALQWVNEWYAGYHQHEDVQKIALDQISTYEDMLR